MRGRMRWPRAARPAGPSTETELWIAVLVNVGLLFTWGAGLRQLAGGTSLQALMAGLASASLGLVLIVLKVLVH
jgi:hypothetical protein